MESWEEFEAKYADDMDVLHELESSENSNFHTKITMNNDNIEPQNSKKDLESWETFEAKYSDDMEVLNEFENTEVSNVYSKLKFKQEQFNANNIEACEDFDAKYADDMEVLNEFENSENVINKIHQKYHEVNRNSKVKRSLKREFACVETSLEGIDKSTDFKKSRIEDDILSEDSSYFSVANRSEDLLSTAEYKPIRRRKIIEFLSVSNSEGLRTRLPLLEEFDSEPEDLDVKKNNLLSVPISVLKYKILQENSLNYRKNLELENEEKDNRGNHQIPKSHESEDNSMLWVEKYRPFHYMELMSDDGVNRTLLHWLKLWDKVVFNREFKKKKVKLENVKQNATQNSKFHMPTFGINEELDEQNRPQYKVALLTGYPGLGKTTLAHVIAYHAGYKVVEMNASDDRNPEHFRNLLEASTQMKAMIGEDPKPNCVIIDEIDGAPLPSINLLVSFIKSTGPTKGRKKKDDFPILKRPIICICNDQYAPSLKPLRQIALILNFPPISTSRLVSRLQEISRKQHLKTDMPALLALCEKAENDIRSCLSTLQFINKQKKVLNVSDVRNLTVGQKDVQKSLFSVWQAIFQIPQLKRKQIVQNVRHIPTESSNKVNEDNTSLTSRFYNILWMAQRCDYEILIQGLFENYLSVNFRDPHLYAIENGTSWLCFADTVNQYIATTQLYSLLPYISYLPVIFHFLFASTSYPQIKFPNSYFEFKSREKKSTNILTTFHNDLSVRAKCFLSKETAILDLLAPLTYITQPTLRPVNTQLYTEAERKELRRVIDTLIDYNLNYSQQRTIDGTYEYVLEPNIEEIVKFPGIKSAPSITYAAKQLIAKEVELEKMRSNDTTKVKTSVVPKNISDNSELKPKVTKIRPNLDFFGRKVDISEKKKLSGSQQLEPDVFIFSRTWFPCFIV
ncbi:chromosome transmission fidelity protein 18 homolog isoform X2 [Centruroides sculpturatus]|uniref:chromosome transmission fidelity protein 18 homolog isoform X2 n=1 Tax=Centruroides sculpturatus TaxID=218467 RepID=UPI000C6DE051|nr:chromosome transmission fidelity protein 18 homolog isoform X2 [Centruroides sculpturatus]